MSRPLTRTNFNSSKLTRLLADLALVDAAESGNAFAEKLGLWVAFTDAIALRAAHDAKPETSISEQNGERCDALEEFTRVKTQMMLATTNRHATSGVRSRIALPIPKVGVSYEDAVSFEPYRRYYLAHQRDMEQQIQSLRAKVRSLLGKTSPALRQLADLDAAFDTILSARESKLLSRLPSLLEQRFKQLLQVHQLAQVDIHEVDNPDLWMNPEGWLSRFFSELQSVQLAELDMRLQPTEGLIEALKTEIDR